MLLSTKFGNRLTNLVNYFFIFVTAQGRFFRQRKNVKISRKTVKQYFTFAMGLWQANYFGRTKSSAAASTKYFFRFKFAKLLTTIYFSFIFRLYLVLKGSMSLSLWWVIHQELIVKANQCWFRRWYYTYII